MQVRKKLEKLGFKTHRHNEKCFVFHADENQYETFYQIIQDVEFSIEITRHHRGNYLTVYVW